MADEGVVDEEDATLKIRQVRHCKGVKQTPYYITDTMPPRLAKEGSYSFLVAQVDLIFGMFERVEVDWSASQTNSLSLLFTASAKSRKASTESPSCVG